MKKNKKSDDDGSGQPLVDDEDLEFIEDNEGKLSVSEIEEILDVDLKTVDENERRILERCDALYEELQHCTDLERYKKICVEYAVISMKAERIRNRDDNAKLRCVEESKYHRTDSRL